MAGRGPAPKDPTKRARRNKDTTPKIELKRETAATKPAARSRRSPANRDGSAASSSSSTSSSTTTVTPPELPSSTPFRDLPWPERTRAWWDQWKSSPQAEHFTASDWDFLLDTAVLHAALWMGDTKAGPELRLRVAKFGATVEDRARLRMTFGDEPKPDGKTPATTSSSRQKFGKLRVVGGTGGAPGA